MGKAWRACRSRIHLHTQAQNEQEVRQGYQPSKPTSSGTIPPAGLLLLNFLCHWEPSFQMHESIEDISHPEHQENTGPMNSVGS